MTYSDLRKQLHSDVSLKVARRVRDPLDRIEGLPVLATDIENLVYDIVWNNIGGVVWREIRDGIQRK